MNKEAQRRNGLATSAGIDHRESRSELLRNEYLAAEDRILRAKIKGRLQLSDGEKSTLAEIARRLGRKALAEVAVVASPDTFCAGFASWWRASLMVRDCDRASGDRESAQPSKI